MLTQILSPYGVTRPQWVNMYIHKSDQATGLVLDMLKMESWNNMGHTANLIIKDIIDIFASTTKNMRILLIGRCYYERWANAIWTSERKIFLSLFTIQCTPDIAWSCISRNWIYLGRMLDPIFLRPRGRHFSRNRCNSFDPIRGRQFFAKSAHCDSLCSRYAGDNFCEINSSQPVNAGWNTCCAKVSHARRSFDTSIVLQSRVQLIQC